MLNNLQLTRLKLFQNEQFKKADTAGDLTGNKITNKITCVSKISRQSSSEKLQISMIKKYLKKDIYLQKKGKKLLMI